MHCLASEAKTTFAQGGLHVPFSVKWQKHQSKSFLCGTLIAMGPQVKQNTWLMLIGGCPIPFSAWVHTTFVGPIRFEQVAASLPPSKKTKTNKQQQRTTATMRHGFPKSKCPLRCYRTALLTWPFDFQRRGRNSLGAFPPETGGLNNSKPFRGEDVPSCGGREHFSGRGLFFFFVLCSCGV